MRPPPLQARQVHKDQGRRKTWPRHWQEAQVQRGELRAPKAPEVIRIPETAPQVIKSQRTPPIRMPSVSSFPSGSAALIASWKTCCQVRGKQLQAHESTPLGFSSFFSLLAAFDPSQQQSLKSSCRQGISVQTRLDKGFILQSLQSCCCLFLPTPPSRGAHNEALPLLQ